MGIPWACLWHILGMSLAYLRPILVISLAYVGQGTINWRASSYPDFIQNYFLLKRMFDSCDNRDKCPKPGFLRGNIYTSCISMVLLDRTKATLSTLSLSHSPISSHFLLGSPLPLIQDRAINGTLAISISIVLQCPSRV